MADQILLSNGLFFLHVGEEAFAASKTDRARRQIREGFIKFTQWGRVADRFAKSINLTLKVAGISKSSFLVDFEGHCGIRRCPAKVEDMGPITYPSRRLPSAKWSPKVASDHPTRDIVPQCTFSPLAHILPSTSQGWRLRAG